MLQVRHLLKQLVIHEFPNDLYKVWRDLIEERRTAAVSKDSSGSGSSGGSGNKSRSSLDIVQEAAEKARRLAELQIMSGEGRDMAVGVSSVATSKSVW